MRKAPGGGVFIFASLAQKTEKKNPPPLGLFPRNPYTVFLLYKHLLYWNLCKNPKEGGWGVLSRFLIEARPNKRPTPNHDFSILIIRAFVNKEGKHGVWSTRRAQIKSPPPPMVFS